MEQSPLIAIIADVDDLFNVVQRILAAIVLSVLAQVFKDELVSAILGIWYLSWVGMAMKIPMKDVVA